MVNRFITIMACCSVIVLGAASYFDKHVTKTVANEQTNHSAIVSVVDIPVVTGPIETTIPAEVQVVEEPVEPEPVEPIQEEPLSEEEINLIALVVMAEAEGESEDGKRLVIDTILNRVDSERFPETVEGVIYQRNQFTSIWNGRADRCYVRDDIYQLVREEMYSRTNYDVMFFTANNYGAYGTPMFAIGNHYFSR